MTHEALADWLVQAEEALNANQKWLEQFTKDIDKTVIYYVKKTALEKK